MTRSLRALMSIAGLAGLLLLLHRIGSGPLAAPPVTDRPDLQRWLDARDAVTVALSMVRLAGMALTAYLLLCAVLGLAAHLTRIPVLVRVAEGATLPLVRGMLGTCAGIGLTVSATSLVAANVVPDPAVAVVRDVSPASEGIALRRVRDDLDVVLRRLPDHADDDDDDDGSATMRVDEPGDGEPGDMPGPSGDAQWVTAPGDHLWHISEAALSHAWGRAPSDAEIAPYWHRVVETNRASLPDPQNPDLIYPGHVLTLPTPPEPR